MTDNVIHIHEDKRKKMQQKMNEIKQAFIAFEEAALLLAKIDGFNDAHLKQSDDICAAWLDSQIKKDIGPNFPTLMGNQLKNAYHTGFRAYQAEVENGD